MTITQLDYDYSNYKSPWYFQQNRVLDAQFLANRGKQIIVHLIDDCVNFSLEGLKDKNYTENAEDYTNYSYKETVCHAEQQWLASLPLRLCYYLILTVKRM